MKNENNFVQGVNGQYSFYVIAFDSQNHFADVNEHIDLTLKQAQEIYSRVILEKPEYVNTILGLVYVTDKMELDRYGKGSVDLLQCINGKIRLCEDYQHSALLSTEGFIVKTVNILENSIGDWQKQLDKDSRHKAVSAQKKYNIDTYSNSLLGKLYENQVKLNDSEYANGSASAQLENL